MTLHILRGAALSAALALVATTSAQPPLPPPDKQDAKKDNAVQPEPGIKVAEKGPIHEAFAQPGAETRGKGMTAPKKPPAPIPELPPETKPDGENVQWVPGYWHWDQDKEDFLWVSGFWRNVPPGRAWQAGEWMEKNGTWMYTPGFWRPTNMNNWRIDLPEPPKTVENGPSTPASDPNAIWIPGQWEYRNEQYVWRAGYWAHPNGDQVWQPGQYLTTGSGYSYCPGYWDYPLEDRGLLNAPVYFNQPLWQNPGWSYTPSYALGLGSGYGGWGSGGLFGSLFYGPGYNNYYYGNYYNPYYTGGYGGYGLGFGYPLFGYGLGLGLFAGFGYGGYYPWWYHNYGYNNNLFRHYCWLNRNNPNWANGVRTNGFAQAAGIAPRQQMLAATNGVNRPLNVSPARGVAGAALAGGAAQTAARTAARTAASQPLIQPANQVARSLNATRANLNSAGANQAAPRIGGANLGSSPRLGGLGASPGVIAGAGRALQVSPPVHAGAIQGVSGSGVRANGSGLVGGQPTIRPGNFGGINSIDRMGGNSILPNQAGPSIRSGTLPGNFSSPSMIGNGRGFVPSSPSFRPSMPATPAFHQSYSNFGGAGRGIMISPGGGARFGGGGGHVGGFGGGHMGGGGGHMGGGGHGGGHR